jgi:hypothetical protein
MRRGVLIAAIVLFLLACKPVVVTETAPAPAAEPVVQPKAAPVAEAEPATVPEPAATVESPPAEEGVYEPPVDAPPSIPLYLDTFKNDVKNYRFTFKNDKWVVQGKNAKVLLFRVMKNEYHAPFIDTIYFDLERRTAVGMCEGRDTNIRKQCALQDVTGKKYSLPYLQFKIRLPHDWLNEFQSMYTSVSETPQLVTDRDTVHLRHLTQVRTTDLWIDPSIGLPLVVIDNGAEYHYDDLVKNQFGADTNVLPIG